MMNRTASDEVRSTYYNLPVIKAPHWRWLIVFYFFFAGLTGSTATIATIAERTGRHDLARLGRYLAFATLLPCPPLLILDLGRPERFLHMLRIIKLKSPMSLGSWALSFHGTFVALNFFVQLISDLFGKDLRAAQRALGLFGLPFSLFMSGYTGMLLSVSNIPIWWRSAPFTSPMFVSSAFSSGLSALSLLLHLMGGSKGTEQAVARAEVIATLAEAGLLTTILLRLGKIGRPLTTGSLALFFWPVTVVGGILVPLGMLLSGPLRGRRDDWGVVSALLSLAGVFSFRATFLLAGHKSAAIPEDYYWMTREENGGR